MPAPTQPHATVHSDGRREPTTPCRCILPTSNGDRHTAEPCRCTIPPEEKATVAVNQFVVGERSHGSSKQSSPRTARAVEGGGRGRTAGQPRLLCFFESQRGEERHHRLAIIVRYAEDDAGGGEAPPVLLLRRSLPSSTSPERTSATYMIRRCPMLCSCRRCSPHSVVRRLRTPTATTLAALTPGSPNGEGGICPCRWCIDHPSRAAAGGTASTAKGGKGPAGPQGLMNRFKRFKNQSGSSMEKTELDRYLREDVEDKEPFDILQWWKVNQPRFPILVEMVRDVLFVPISTVASESTFSTGGRVLNDFRSSLTPKTVEALICTQDWVRARTKPVTDEEDCDVLENIEKGRRGCGGVLRKFGGEWMGGFMGRENYGDATMLDVTAIVRAMEWAWGKGIRDIEIQSDAKNVVDWIHERTMLRGLIQDLSEVAVNWVDRN
nr:zinc finger BED domain-containing protein RICESLEEPER 2-like [Ipomoea batatas]